MNADQFHTPSDPSTQQPLQEVDGDLEPKFRVVIVSQKRRGIRLEQLYWRLLKNIAERQGRKRSRLIAAILEASEGSTASKASQLRGFVTRTLEKERNEFEELHSDNSVIQLIHQAPIPAFAIDRQKHLSLINQEFIQLIRIIGGNMSQQISTDSVSLMLDTPIEKLFATLQDTDQTICNYSLQIHGKQRRGRAKIIAIPPQPYSRLVGFVTS